MANRVRKFCLRSCTEYHSHVSYTEYWLPSSEHHTTVTGAGAADAAGEPAIATNVAVGIVVWHKMK